MKNKPLKVVRDEGAVAALLAANVQEKRLVSAKRTLQRRVGDFTRACQKFDAVEGIDRIVFGGRQFSVMKVMVSDKPALSVYDTKSAISTTNGGANIFYSEVYETWQIRLYTESTVVNFTLRTVSEDALWSELLREAVEAAVRLVASGGKLVPKNVITIGTSMSKAAQAAVGAVKASEVHGA